MFVSDEARLLEDGLLEAAMEFGQMADNLSLGDASDVALKLHARHSRLDGTPLWGHLQAVSRASKKLAEDFYKESSVAEGRYWVKVAQIAGLLHESQLRCGITASFEALAARGGAADEAVARAVGALTPDVRISRPYRNEMFSNSLGRGLAVAQIVKLADLRHDVVMMVELVRDRAPMILDPVTDYCLEARAALESLNHLRDHEWSMRVARETRDQLAGLQKFTKCTTRRVARR